MMKLMIRLMVVLLLLVGSTPNLWAQRVEKKRTTSYDPGNPPDPSYETYYNVNISFEPKEAAYTYAAGQCKEGTQKWIYFYSRNSSFKFKHWTLDGEVFSTSQSFYLVVNKDVNLVAHFEYNPSSPSEPQREDKYRLDVQSDMVGACSFNISSGTMVKYDTYQYLSVTVNTGFEFLGWYDGGTLVSTSTSFNYSMPDRNVILTAKFRYNPGNPAEPGNNGTQDNVQTVKNGDVNRDGVVDVFDVVATVERTLNTESTELGLYDVNGDGEVDVFDVVEIINISLTEI